ncbi:hypothetical protein A3F62_02420 [Candidatus Woesebacteria bacterium RIFCSPHIGHO2_12_FULL_44_11]|uniref:Uncharacterized protein n=1 Tax=Candidatus Woesebacteria bacterium RIFCSPLOWO2_01_FULL_44_14 TaxID=1802525 RepID=A0A1F8C3P9_9BACT|nr:MAG: hypothetical protein A3F62_02420 [Candidatus Woesebacteria bacterium RIFCSPHIGHO2_12_FULL_44_11]OGM70916.1 MAG: hypothetical protein A2975_01410 [Candidatus Woesebacteria bacterium RIFCSPLOWO2_01_FULL_44_14]
MIERFPGANEIAPERELFTQDGYRWFVYSAEQTGLRLICLEDLDIGVVVTTTVANPDKRTAAHRAWAGARHSRAPGMPWEIMQEMGEKGVDPDQKLDELFRGYGHASVGDMASLEVDIVNCPMHLCFAMFNDTAINSGQEKSTRYQKKFGGAVLHGMRHYLPEDMLAEAMNNLEGQYQEFGELSLQFFAKHQEALTVAFDEFYQPTDKKEETSLNSRVLDCVRYFLLFGQNSGFSLETSARDWSRLIGDLKASPIAPYRKIAAQVERLLAPSHEEEEELGYKAEAPGLIRHTEVSSTTNTNLSELREFIAGQTDLLEKVAVRRNFREFVEQEVGLLPGRFSEGDKMAAQYLLILWPGFDRGQLLDWVRDLPLESKESISGIIFKGHDNYHEMSDLARTTGMTLTFEGFLGELRDLNRHRAWGRFVPLPLVFGEPMNVDTAYQVMARGFGLPLYLGKEMPGFNNLRQEFIKDMDQYYQKLYCFVGDLYDQLGETVDYSFVINLLPLAHQVSLWMHADPKQALYMTHQRVRPGGHINYRDQVWRANMLISGSDPYLSGMQLGERPDPASRDEFFNRS